MRRIALALLPLLLAGCGSLRLGGERSVSEENDRLRALVHEQRERIRALEGERDELKVKLAAANQARGEALPQEVVDALPAVTAVRISMLSGLEPVDATRPATGVSVTFEPLDGRSRVTQAVGTVSIEAYLMPEGAGEPRKIAQAKLSPGELRDAYRSNLTGTYYTVTLPLAEPMERRGATPGLLIRLEFADALTGQVHRAERLLPGRSGTP